MATLHSSHLLSASSHLRISPKSALETRRSLSPLGFEGSLQRIFSCNFGGLKPYGTLQNFTPNPFHAMSVAAGQSGDPRRAKIDHLIDMARTLWENSPQPVKSFPWNHALDSFIQLTLDLVVEVVKYLSVPLLVVTALSEMSYCAHERKLKLIVFPLFIGIAVAGVLRQTALDVSPRLKDAEVPWHLIGMAIFFTLLKLPGPYYPYWGRILIPHFANGGLLRALWFAFLWYRRPRQASRTTSVQDSKDESQILQEKNDQIAFPD